MQVSVETTGALGRRMTVQVPAERVDREVENRLKRMARTVRLDGFRPGKVPLRVVESRYGSQVRAEVVSEVMRTTLQEAFAEQELRPAGGPQIEPQRMDPGQALEYTATFEVYPEFQPASLEGAHIEKPVAEVTDREIDNMLEKLRRQRAEWEPVDREAREGDRVVIDFEGSVDGEPFSGNTGTSVPVELGSNRMIPGFEEQLTGVRAGEERTLEATFPEDYGLNELAGKTAQFKVKVHTVSEPRVPELDEAFAQTFGVQEGGIEKLREEVRRNMERERDQAVQGRLKEQAFDVLLEKNPIEVPQTLVDEEVHRLMEQAGVEHDATEHGEAHAQLEPRARRRVALGLVLAELVRQQGIQVDPERVRSLIETVASTYENPQEVARYYQENAEMRSGMEALALEDQVVDWIVEQANVEEKPTTFDELMKSRQAADA
ncbi:MAG TPA: trigger factor [Gammaproteobacteria bacterium]|nr:trigger factor [Gammaproteobacteria bacterium]